MRTPLPLAAALALAFLAGCPGAVPPGSSGTTGYRLPGPDATSPPPSPSPTPLPTPPPAVNGHVTAPAGLLGDAPGLATTDGQGRLPLLNSGLLVNNGVPLGYVIQDAAATGEAALPGALVVLTDLDQKPYTDATTQVALSATTSADGSYRIPLPATFGPDAVVLAYPSGSQRLTALWTPGSATVDVDLATTLATELLRNQALLAGKTPSKYDLTAFGKLVDGTRAALLSGAIASTTTVTDDAGSPHVATLFDLRLDQAQALRNQYAVALSAVAPTSPLKPLSDGWAALTGQRPRAVTTRLGNGLDPAVGPSGVEGDEATTGSQVPLGVLSAVLTTPNGDVFIACSTASPTGGYVRWIQPDGHVTSLAMPLPMQAPAGLALAPDGTHLLVADEGLHRVLRLALAKPGGTAPALDVVAGEDRALAQEPEHPEVVDGPDGLDVAHATTSRWRLSDEGQRAYRTTGNLVPNPARFARLARPGAMTFDELGNLYIADRGNQRIRMIPPGDGQAFGYRTPIDKDGDGVVDGYGAAPATLHGGCIYTIVGAPMWDPSRTSLDPDGHWFGDFADAAVAQEARLDEPSGLAFYDGWLYIADRENQRVRRVSRATGAIETVAGMPPGSQVATQAQHAGAPTDFEFPTGTAGDGGPAAQAQLSYPSGLALDLRDLAHPLLFIADQGSGRIRRIDLLAASRPIATVAGRVHDKDGALDRVDHDRDGEALAYVDLFQLRGLAVDAAGNLLMTDGLHRRLRELWLQWQ